MKMVPVHYRTDYVRDDENKPRKGDKGLMTR